MNKPTALLLCGLVPACFAAERATYDSAGGLTALIANNVELPVRGEFRVTFAGGVSATLQPDDQRSSAAREGPAPHWTGTAVFPNGTKATYTANWTESDAGVTLDGTTAPVAAFPGPAAARFPLDLASVDYVVDLPRDTFIGGKIEPSGTALPVARPEAPAFFRDTVGALTLVDAKGNWTLALSLDQPRPVAITDRWDKDGRSYRVTIQLHQGPWLVSQPVKLGLALKLSGTPAPVAAHLTVNPAEKLGPFDGFGGNYRIFMDSPVTDYTLKNLHLAWARLSFDALAWVCRGSSACGSCRKPITPIPTSSPMAPSAATSRRNAGRISSTCSGATWSI